MKVLNTIVLTVLFCAVLFPASPFEKAAVEYKKGNFEAALKLYQQGLGSGQESASVYYNMGNCYYRTGKVGYAVLYYEKARLISPNDEDINHNLQIARLHTPDKIDVVPKLFLFRWFETAFNQMNADGWMKLLILLVVVICALCQWFVLSRSMAVRRYLAMGFVFVLALAAATGVFLYQRYQIEQSHEYGVLVEYASNGKYSPNAGSNDAFVIHEGIKVKIEDMVDDWYKIRLEDGKVGWIQKGHLEII